ncbi:MAG: cell division protease FtsH, partial [Eubacteriaceae bacterium]|nr:cell division protease FtsH [Eubacteriaceae bacterium]
AVIDKEIRNIVENAFERACAILNEQRDKLEEIAQRLLKDKTVTGEEFKALFEGLPIEEAEIVEVVDGATEITE